MEPGRCSVGNRDTGDWYSAMSDEVVYLLRHGRTLLNAEGVLRGHSDVPLDAAGLREACELGKLFTGVPLVAVVTSPLRRARATARQVASATSAPLLIDPRLVDRDYGPWTGMPEVQARALVGGFVTPLGAEPLSVLKERVLAAFGDAVEYGASGPVALVAHDAVNRILLTELVPHLGDPARLPQPTGCWNGLKRAGDGWEAQAVGVLPGDGTLPWAS